MENNEQQNVSGISGISGTEKVKNNRGVTQNPTRYNNSQPQKNMKSEDDEINPSDLDRDEVDLDKGGVEFSGSEGSDEEIARDGYNGNAGTQKGSQKGPVSRQ